MNKSLHTALIEASAKHKKKSRQGFQILDLSEGQPKVLVYLYDNEGCLQKELAEMCHVEPATMTVLLQNMVNTGLILKKAVHVSGGKRAFGIYLTDPGREKAAKVFEIMDEVEQISFKGFSEAERNMLIEFLLRMAENLA